MKHNVPPLAKVANNGTNYFLLKIKIISKRKRELTKKKRNLAKHLAVVLY